MGRNQERKEMVKKEGSKKSRPAEGEKERKKRDSGD